MLCDDNATREQRLELLQSLNGHVFLDPEHGVVFESIRALFKTGPLFASRLAVHLNNRGFPEIDMGRYFSATRASAAPSEISNKEKT